MSAKGVPSEPFNPAKNLATSLASRDLGTSTLLIGSAFAFSAAAAGTGGLLWPQEQQIRKPIVAVKDWKRDNTEFYCSDESMKSKKVSALNEDALI